MQKSWKMSCPMTSDSPGAGHRCVINILQEEISEEGNAQAKRALGFSNRKGIQKQSTKMFVRKATAGLLARDPIISEAPSSTGWYRGLHPQEDSFPCLDYTRMAQWLDPDTDVSTRDL